MHADHSNLVLVYDKFLTLCAGFRKKEFLKRNRDLNDSGIGYNSKAGLAEWLKFFSNKGMKFRDKDGTVFDKQETKYFEENDAVKRAIESISKEQVKKSG